MDRPLDEALGLISSRTDLAEILSDGPHSLFLAEETCYSFDLGYTVHAPVADVNIASENEHLRRATIRVLADLASVCDRIGAARLVIHPGHIWGEEVRDAARRALDRSLDDLAALQREVSVRFAIENMGAWDICFFREPGFLDRLAALDLVPGRRRGDPRPPARQLRQPGRPPGMRRRRDRFSPCTAGRPAERHEGRRTEFFSTVREEP